MRQKGQVLSIRLLIILLFARALFLLQYLNCKSSWSEEQNNIVPLYLFIMYNQMMHAPNCIQHMQIQMYVQLQYSNTFLLNLNVSKRLSEL